MSRLFGRREERAKAEKVPELVAPSTGGGAWPAVSDASARRYSPYAGLAGTFDPAISRALLDLPEAPEFVFSEEAAMQQRTWSENLTYITGVAYLGGALAGGVYGAAQGGRLQPAGVESTKLRLNRVLNAGGKSGRALGNSAGVAGLLFSSLDSIAVHARNRRDGVNTILAGAGAGALYKAPAGARAAAVWGAAGAMLGALSVAGTALADRM